MPRDNCRCGLADHGGAGIDKLLHDRRGARGRRMRGKPVRVAAAGYMAGDVEQILGRALTLQALALSSFGPIFSGTLCFYLRRGRVDFSG
jgi:hypothetical protein